MDKKKLLDSLAGGLIVSCQSQPGDIIHEEGRTVVTMAKAAAWAGAVAIRANSPEQIAAIHEAVDLPIIGLWKIKFDTEPDFIMTPDLDSAKAVYKAGAAIIALDCQVVLAPGGKRRRVDLIPLVKKEIPDALIFADVATLEDAKAALEFGADIIAPTLFGYTPQTIDKEPPDWRGFAALCELCKGKAKVIMEGHIYTPEDAIKALYLGAHAVVVGSAITRPQLIAKRFVDLMGGLKPEADWRKSEQAWTGVETKSKE